MKSTYGKINPVPTFKQGELVYTTKWGTTFTLDALEPAGLPAGTQVVLVTGPGNNDSQFSGVLLFEFFSKNLPDEFLKFKNLPINRLGNHFKDWSKRRFQLFKDTLEISN